MLAEQAIALLACGLCLSAATLAEEEVAPEADFLEYLGMWQESDEEWLLHEELYAAERDEQGEPVPEDEEPTETNDES